jgi:hypothetical protein
MYRGEEEEEEEEEEEDEEDGKERHQLVKVKDTCQDSQSTSGSAAWPPDTKAAGVTH